MTQDAENKVSIMEKVGTLDAVITDLLTRIIHHQTEVGSKTLLMVSHPYKRTVRWLEGRPQLKWMEKAVHQVVHELWMGS